MYLKLVRYSNCEGGDFYSIPFSAGYVTETMREVIPGEKRNHNAIKKSILRVMKLTAIILLTACLTVSAGSKAQKITWSGTNVSLKEVFSVIREQSGYTVFYNYSLLQNARKVTINVKDATVEEVLVQALKGQNLSFDIEDRMIVITEKQPDQNPETPVIPPPPIDVHGKVVNEKGEPVEGVTVTVKGTKNATATDADGLFQLKNVDGNAVLVFSGVNVESYEVKVGGKTDLKIVKLKTKVIENEGINVTVNTGYQEINKESATGSYEKIDNSLFNRSTGTTILSRLDGIAGSVLFDHREGSDAPIQIRGISSINSGSTSPLIILDNFPYEGDLNSINPNDIENITILKDAAASSIWGAKAGNGVIVITTKKAKFNQPFKLTVNSDVIVTEKPNLFTQKNMSTSDFIDVEQFLFKNGYYNSSLNNIGYYPPLSPVVEILAQQQAGSLTEAEATAQINALRTLDVRNDFEKYLYRAGVTQQYGVNLSGGSQKFKYLLSGGYDRNMATLVGNRDDRFTIRSNNTLIPVKNLEFDISLGYTRSNVINNSPGGYNNITIAGSGAALYPYAKLADNSGNPLSIDYMYSGSFTDTAGAGILLDWKYSPLNELKNVNMSTVTNALIANIGMKFSFSKDLNAEIKYQFQNTQANSNTVYNVNSFEARNLINEFTQYDGTNINYIVPYGGILDAGQNNLDGYGLRGQLDFNKTINTEHNINAIAGAEILQTSMTSSNYRSYGYDDNMNTSAVDYANFYPTFDNVIGNATVPAGNEFASTLDRYVSVYGNATYTYNKLYTLSGSFRKDASNLFGVKANQRGVPLWSAGAAWNISNEKSYNMQWLPFLKLRFTYGYSGNVSKSVSALTTLSYYSAADQTITNVPFASVSNYPNSKLQWEKVGMMNIGIDFGSRNSRISGSIEFYKKNSSDLLGSEPLDPTVGTLDLFTNSANMKGHGFDVVLNSRNVVGKKFKWESNFIFSSVKNKITKYLDDMYTDGYTSDGQYINPLTGYEPYLIVSYKWAGLNSDGNPQGYINGQKSTNYDSLIYYTPLKDQSISGTAIPHFFGSLINTFRFGRLSLSFNITYRLGYYFRKPSLNYTALFQYGRGDAEFSKRWQKPGDEKITNVPALIYPDDYTRSTFYQYSDINVEKADNIRLNDLRLAYDLSPAIDHKLSLQSFEVFAYASNLNVLIWKANKVGIDPEFPTGLKTPITASFGIRTNF